jgi:hypothetical protein
MAPLPPVANSRAADRFRRNARDRADGLGAVLRVGHEGSPVFERVGIAEGAHELLVDEPLRHDHMRQRIQDGGVGARPQREMIVGLHMRRAHQIDPPRIDHDQPRALAQPLLHARGEDRMRVGRVGADHQDHVALLDRVEVLRARRCAECRPEAVAGRRMADAGAGIDIVVAEAAAHQLLHQIGLLVRAARGGDAADGEPAVFLLQALEVGGDAVDRGLPAHLAPRLVDAVAQHGLQDALAMVGVAPGEAALDARVAAIGLAVLVRHHAHQLLATHLRLEAAAHAAIGAGRDDRMLGPAELDHRLLDQRIRRTGLHAGAARHALGAQEVVDRRAGRDLRLEAPALDGKGEGALHLVAGAHAARADDALGRIEHEIGIRLVLRLGQMIDAVVAVAHLAEAHRFHHLLQVVSGGTGRMIRKIELHHAATDLRQPLTLRRHDHVRGNRRRAGGRRAGSAGDLDQAQTARAERFQRIGGAELGHVDARFDGGAHDRGAGGHGDTSPVDRQRNLLGRLARRCAVVGFDYE